MTEIIFSIIQESFDKILFIERHFWKFKGLFISYKDFNHLVISFTQNEEHGWILANLMAFMYATIC